MPYFKYTQSVSAYASPTSLIASGTRKVGDIIYFTTLNPIENGGKYYVQNQPGPYGSKINDTLYSPIYYKFSGNATTAAYIKWYGEYVNTSEEIEEADLSGVTLTITASKTPKLTQYEKKELWSTNYNQGDIVVVVPFDDGSYTKTARGNTYYRVYENGKYYYIRQAEADGTVNATASTINNPVQSVSTSTSQQATNSADDASNKTNSDISNNSASTPADTSDGNVSSTTYEPDINTTTSSNTADTETDEFLGEDSNIEAYQDYLDTLDTSYVETNLTGVESVLGVFGLPYQFMPHVDPRIDGSVDDVSGIGVDYAEKIIGSIPLLFISPGKPAFMSGYDNDEQKTVLQQWISERITGEAVGSVEDLLSEDGKFYSFEYDVVNYYNYVNPMCRICAKLLGIDGAEYSISDRNNDSIDWREFTQGGIKGIASLQNDYLAIPFYLDSDTQISENMSNDVTDSSLASTVDSFSDMGRELMFYLGYTPALMGFDSITSAEILNNTENLQNYISSISGDNIFKSLLNQVTTVATGGRLEFPKIWADSSFTRSYDVNIKLRSPDMDNLSLWTNIIVPLCHILGFVQPRMVPRNPNAFTSPFLVRAIYKGFFNVDMGIITSCNISKGDDAQWSINGIPTTVDVSLTIMDMYDVMSIAPGSGMSSFQFDVLDNTAQMDYLMNLCGINIYKPELGRLLDLYLTQLGANRLTDAFSNIFANLRQSVTNKVTSIYRGL